MKNLICLVLSVIIISCSKAQEPPKTPQYDQVIPGDPSLVIERIKPHKVKYEKSGGFMTYIMKQVNEGGKEAFELAVYFNTDEKGVPDLMYFDKQTLGYLSRKMKMEGYTLEVGFNDNKFAGQLIPTKGSGYKPVTYDKDYPHNAFEPAIINYFIAALPLEKGYKASLPVFDLNSGSQMYWSNIEVIGKETIKIGDKKYDAWKVESKGIKEKTIWISTEVPYALRMKTKGSWGTWEIAE